MGRSVSWHENLFLPSDSGELGINLRPVSMLSEYKGAGMLYAQDCDCDNESVTVGVCDFFFSVYKTHSCVPRVFYVNLP